MTNYKIPRMHLMISAKTVMGTNDLEDLKINFSARRR